MEARKRDARAPTGERLPRRNPSRFRGDDWSGLLRALLVTRLAVDHGLELL